MDKNFFSSSASTSTVCCILLVLSLAPLVGKLNFCFTSRINFRLECLIYVCCPFTCSLLVYIIVIIVINLTNKTNIMFNATEAKIAVKDER